MNQRLLAYAALIITVVIWGVAGPVIKATFNEGLTPFTFLTLRFLLNVLIISPILFFYLKRHPIRWRDTPRLFLLTFLGTTLTLTLIFLGLEKTTALDAVLIIATAPIFIVVAGAIFLKEKITSLEKVGLMVALTGVGITIIQPLLERGLFAQENLVGNLLILASNITWTAFTIISKEDLKRHSPFLITGSAFIFGLLTFIPLAIIENPNLIETVRNLGPSAWAGVFYMSVFSSIVAYFAYNWGLSKIEASEAALFLYLEPVFAAPLAYIWLGEAITPTFLIGATVIAAGVILTEYRPPRVAHLRHR